MSACSLPLILAWALTLWSVVVSMRDCSIWTIDSRTFVFCWLLYIVGCLICVFSTYKTLRPSMKIWVGLPPDVVVKSDFGWGYRCHSLFFHVSNVPRVFL